MSTICDFNNLSVSPECRRLVNQAVNCEVSRSEAMRDYAVSFGTHAIGPGAIIGNVRSMQLNLKRSRVEKQVLKDLNLTAVPGKVDETRPRYDAYVDAINQLFLDKFEERAPRLVRSFELKDLSQKT